jgi:hypothetical protein
MTTKIISSESLQPEKAQWTFRIHLRPKLQVSFNFKTQKSASNVKLHKIEPDEIAM